MTAESQPDSTPLSRRSVVRGGAVGGVALPVLAACGGNGNGAQPAAPSQSAPASAGRAGDGKGAVGSGGLVSTSAVPVGGGTILNQEQIVVTQPAKGDFKAFTAVCTHQGCLVGAVRDGVIECPCHGSQFSIEDGSNVVGPSGTPAGSVAPLAAVPITVKAGEVLPG